MRMRRAGRRLWRRSRSRKGGKRRSERPFSRGYFPTSSRLFAAFPTFSHLFPLHFYFMAKRSGLGNGGLDYRSSGGGGVGRRGGQGGGFMREKVRIVARRFTKVRESSHSTGP